jgi:hypothetical protein
MARLYSPTRFLGHTHPGIPAVVRRYGAATRQSLNSGRLDGKGVHQSSVTACLRSPGDGPQRRQEVRTFGTTTRELLGLADWLTAAGCTHVAMESTGVYWRPIYNLLEVRFALSVVNAQHVKMVPGRKTAGRDSECRAQLLELGLLRRRFVAAGGAARAARRGALPQALDRGARPGGEPRPPRDGEHRAPLQTASSAGHARPQVPRNLSPGEGRGPVASPVFKTGRHGPAASRRVPKRPFSLAFQRWRSGLRPRLSRPVARSWFATWFATLLRHTSGGRALMPRNPRRGIPPFGGTRSRAGPPERSPMGRSA